MLDATETGILLHLCRGTVLEIGTHKGATTTRMAEVADRVVTVDVLEVPHTTIEGHEGCCLPPSEIGCQIPATLRSKVTQHLINPNVPGELGRVLKSEGVLYDLIFIDGDHSIAGVQRDFETSAPWLSPTGVMLFHDCWWREGDTEMGPMHLLRRHGGIILNKTLLGVLEVHLDRLYTHLRSSC